MEQKSTIIIIIYYLTLITKFNCKILNSKYCEPAAKSESVSLAAKSLSSRFVNPFQRYQTGFVVKLHLVQQSASISSLRDVGDMIQQLWQA